jgi:mRNA interferase MazF
VKSLKQGDIVFTDLYPTVGHEQSGNRPVLVLSNKSSDKYSSMTIVCPITTNDRVYPTKVVLKNTNTKGFVLCDQIRALDMTTRNFTYVENLDEETLWNVIDIVTGLIKILETPT